MLILGLGPSGLLFVQYLRNVIGFDGELFAADLQETKLELAAQFGASSVNVRNQDLVSEIQTRTGGKKLDCVIEATGSGSVFDEMPALLRRQATVLFYGAGHSGRDIGCLTPFQAAEVHLVTSGGASGGFDSDGNPSTYRAAMQAIHDGRIEVSPLISHRYQQLVELEQAFVQDFRRPEYIKGIVTHPNRQDHLGAGTSPSRPRPFGKYFTQGVTAAGSRKCDKGVSSTDLVKLPTSGVARIPLTSNTLYVLTAPCASGYATQLFRYWQRQGSRKDRYCGASHTS